MPQMAVDDFGEDGTEVRRHRQVASLIALLPLEPRPAPINLSTSHRAADDHHRVAMPMIGPTIPVLHDRATELRHGQHDDVLHAIAEVTHERGHAARQIVETVSEDADCGSFIDVMIPVSRFGERYLETDIRLDELSDLLERLAER